MTVRKSTTPVRKKPTVPRVPKVPDVDGLLPEGERRELEVQEKVRQLEVTDEARRRLEEAKAGALEIPTPESLSRFLRRKMPPERYVIDNLWPVGGNIMFSAQRKAGKTTIGHNLMRSLVDGDPFMDHFDVLTTRRVLLLDFEMSDRMLQHWLKDQRIRNTANLKVVNMRGKAGSFRITDDKMRARWARVIEDTGAEVLVVDPMRPVLDAIGLKEANEGGPFLQAFDALKVEAGVSEGMIAHHHGHVAERAAGDSRFEGWPDAIWNVTRQDMTDPDSFRYFEAFGRDVSVPKGMVLMNESRRVAFKTDIPEETKSAVMDRLVMWLLEQNGERNTGQIQDAGIKGINKNNVAERMRTAVSTGRVEIREGERGSKWYRPAQHP
ncbi:AAA family ATPase [Clavibacter californiensis]|uniref:AAA domain-containing protein n=1 Tax=Clavibacter californiensis TaxID=1401995 RepID=A0ABX9N8D4_9MICO|nr:AAA family ATPase [Clavibacter californiensis]RII93285.1 hypothetical protein DZF98_04755 [Clavibacter californiensis]UKF78920.1 AAA family ATPase [Clavibacter californiensis]